MKPTNPTDGTNGFDSNPGLALWMNEFTRTIALLPMRYSRAFTKSSFVTHYRWKSWKHSIASGISVAMCILGIPNRVGLDEIKK